MQQAKRLTAASSGQRPAYRMAEVASNWSGTASREEAALFKVAPGKGGSLRVDLAEAESDVFPLAIRAGIILGSCSAFWIYLATLIF